MQLKVSAMIVTLLAANLAVSINSLPRRQSDATMKVRELVITDDAGVARARLKHDTHTSLAFLGSDGGTLLEIMAAENGTTGLRVLVPRTEGEVFVGEHAEVEQAGLEVRSKEKLTFFSGLKETSPMSTLAGPDGKARAVFAIHDGQPVMGLCTPAEEPRLMLSLDDLGVACIDFIPAGEEVPRLALTDGRTGTFMRFRDQQGVSRVMLGVDGKSQADIEVRDGEGAAASFGQTPNGLGMKIGSQKGGDHLWLGRREDGHCGVGFFFPNGKPMGGITTSDEGADLAFFDIDGQVLFKGPRK